MIKYTDREYKERVEKLPKMLKEIINSLDFLNFIYNTTINYKILYPIDKSFKVNLYAVLIGLLPPHKYKDELIKDGMDPELAEKVSQKVHYYVFREVKEELQEIYTEIKIAPRGEVIEKREKDKYHGLSSLDDPEKIEKRKQEIEKYEADDPYIEKI